MKRQGESGAEGDPLQVGLSQIVHYPTTPTADHSNRA